MKPIPRISAIVVALIAISTQSFAQSTGGGMGGGRRGHGADSQTSSRANEQTPDREATLNNLRDKLYDLRLRMRITSEQSGLWESLSATLWDLAVRASLLKAPPSDNLSAEQAIQQRLTVAQEQTLRLQRVKEALLNLYATLTPEQRETADQYVPSILP